MRIASTINATSISHQGHTYEPGQDGVFDVPDHVAAELLTWPHYVPEHEALDTAAVEQARTDMDPALLHRRVADLENSQQNLTDVEHTITDVRKRLDGLEKKLGDLAKKLADLETVVAN